MTASHASDRARVDVVIPLYNQRSSIGRAVSSVLGQSYRSWRLFIVDDGSTDGWELPCEDSRIVVVRQDNSGPGAARNHGAAAGTAEFIAFLDADDEWEPSYLECMVRVLDEVTDLDAVSAAWSGPRRMSDDDGSSGPRVVRWSADMSVRDFKRQVDAMHSSATVVTRSAFARGGGFYENRCTFGEDSYFWASLAITGKVARLADRLILFHTDHSALSAGRTTPHPLPPLLVDPAPFRRRIGWRWDTFMPRYLTFYASWVLARRVREGAGSDVLSFLRRGGLTDLGLNRRQCARVAWDCVAAWIRRAIKTLLGRQLEKRR